MLYLVRITLPSWSAGCSSGLYKCACVYHTAVLDKLTILQVHGGFVEDFHCLVIRCQLHVISSSYRTEKSECTEKLCLNRVFLCTKFRKLCAAPSQDIAKKRYERSACCQQNAPFHHWMKCTLSPINEMHSFTNKYHPIRTKLVSNNYTLLFLCRKFQRSYVLPFLTLRSKNYFLRMLMRSILKNCVSVVYSCVFSFKNCVQLPGKVSLKN